MTNTDTTPPDARGSGAESHNTPEENESAIHVFASLGKGRAALEAELANDVYGITTIEMMAKVCYIEHCDCDGPMGRHGKYAREVFAAYRARIDELRKERDIAIEQSERDMTFARQMKDTAEAAERGRVRFEALSKDAMLHSEQAEDRIETLRQSHERARALLREVWQMAADQAALYKLADDTIAHRISDRIASDDIAAALLNDDTAEQQ